MKVVNQRKLSAMEYTVLGIAWKRGPCTTYLLMKELSSSTSTYYKGRAGTAYPLVDRLVTAGYLLAGEVDGSRGERQIEISAKGKDALTQWVREPIPASDIAHTVDWIRLRVFYLGTLAPEERLNFITGAVAGLKAQLEACEQAVVRYREMGDDFSVMATTGTIFETKARIVWLQSLLPSFQA